MRFDDALDTVLSADPSTPSGAQAMWRQLIDLVGRGRAPATEEAIDRLRTLRMLVPPPVRGASARALEFAQPPALLVQLFAEDELAIAAPVLRTALLASDDWIAMLPAMSPTSRSLLRNRRDLAAEVRRALESFGPTDFILPGAENEIEIAVAVEAEPAPESWLVWKEAKAQARSADLAFSPQPAQIEIATPEPEARVIPLLARENSFVSLAEAARAIPIVAEALRRSQSEPDPVAEIPSIAPLPPERDPVGPFEISDLVARIDAFQRSREEQPALPFLEGDLHASPIEGFRFETDARGVVRWVSGVVREPLIGLSLDLAAVGGGVRTDGIAGGAFRRRAPFSDARLSVDGHSDAAGDWRISATPVFEPVSGRFTGYRGTARRPRVDEQAEPVRRAPPVNDSLRQLVHELRTPTNAIAGFAEMIEAQMLGPVPASYREHAATIREQTRELIGAIDDIDTAARIDAGALDIRNAEVRLSPIFARLAEDLRPLAELRRAQLRIAVDGDLVADGDDRAIERLLSRLMATVLSAAAADEEIAVGGALDGEDGIAIVIDRPAALSIDLDSDAETEAAAPGGPLLGTGFALRLAQNLARELGGSLDLGAQRLTLRLPAVVDRAVEQATNL